MLHAGQTLGGNSFAGGEKRSVLASIALSSSGLTVVVHAPQATGASSISLAGSALVTVSHTATATGAASVTPVSSSLTILGTAPQSTGGASISLSTSGLSAATSFTQSAPVTPPAPQTNPMLLWWLLLEQQWAARTQDGTGKLIPCRMRTRAGELRATGSATVALSIRAAISIKPAALHCRGRARARLSGSRMALSRVQRVEVQAGSQARLRSVNVSIYKVNKVRVRAVCNPSDEELAVLTEIL